MRYVNSPTPGPAATRPILGGRTAARYLFIATVSLALAALALPLLGPLVDHHFAERQPGHAHAFLSGVSTRHAHTQQTDHPHAPLGMEFPNLAAGPAALQDTVVFLPDDTEAAAAGLSLALLTAVAVLALPSVTTLFRPRGPKALQGRIPPLIPPPPRRAA